MIEKEALQMKRLIRIACVVAVLSLMTTTVVWVQEDAKEPATPRIIAVKFHADW